MHLSMLVDFGHGHVKRRFIRRVQNDAEIAANHGASFGTGGESF